MPGGLSRDLAAGVPLARRVHQRELVRSKRGAQRPPTGLVHGGKTMRPSRGQAGNTDVGNEHEDIKRRIRDASACTVQHSMGEGSDSLCRRWMPEAKRLSRWAVRLATGSTLAQASVP